MSRNTCSPAVNSPRESNVSSSMCDYLGLSWPWHWPLSFFSNSRTEVIICSYMINPSFANTRPHMANTVKQYFYRGSPALTWPEKKQKNWMLYKDMEFFSTAYTLKHIDSKITSPKFSLYIVGDRWLKRNVSSSSLLNPFKTRRHLILNSSDQIRVYQHHNKAVVHYLQMRVHFIARTYTENFNKASRSACAPTGCLNRHKLKPKGDKCDKSQLIHRAQDYKVKLHNSSVQQMCIFKKNINHINKQSDNTKRVLRSCASQSSF